MVTGPRVPVHVLREHAASVGSPFFEAAALQGAVPPGDYDEENSMIARAALQLLVGTKGFEKLDARAITKGCATRPPCRFEILPREGGGVLVLDVGHNPPALAQLMALLAKSFPGKPLRFVLGMSKDKAMMDCLAIVMASGANIRHVHLVQASHPRAATPEVLLQDAVAAGADARLFSPHPGSASGGSVTLGVHAALAAARGQPDEVVVVCGSVFIMGEAREALGFDEPRDSQVISEVAGSHFKSSQEHFGAPTK